MIHIKIEKFIFLSLSLVGASNALAQDFSAYMYDESTKAAIPGVPALKNGMQVDGAVLQGKALNILVVPKFSGVKSISFSHNNGKARNENEAPYTVLKETGSGNNAVLAPGSHSFVARAFSEPSGKGKLLKELRLSFTILSGPDTVAPELVSRSVANQFDVSVTFNEEARASLLYAPQGSEDWRSVESSDFKTTHAFSVTDADAQGWVYKVQSEDVAGNSGESSVADLVVTAAPPPPPPTRDYQKLINGQFVKGDRAAKNHAAYLAKNKKQYKWPAGRSKDNPHDCYIVARAYYDHMHYHRKGYAPIRSLYICPKFPPQ